MAKWILTAATVAGVLLAGSGVQTQEPGAQPAARKPELYLVATAHLDTQWNWTVQDSIRKFIPSTFFDNFTLIDRFPHYVFTFEGAIHYMWFKEYHPDSWARLQKYVASDRWRLAGSWLNAVDTHVPSPESLMRQALYAKRFFRNEFGKVSQDVFLPDCFGFGYALPSTAAACGLKAFSTQKLSWGAPFPPPFAVGRWYGVDGSMLVSALRAGDYVKEVRTDPSTDPKWIEDTVALGNGRSVGFRYFGVGDQGGAPDVESVEWVEKGIANPDAKAQVKNTSADQLSRDLTDREIAALPEYRGELLLKTHGVGCYTSQAAMKKFNRQNEQLADATERASVVAEAISGLPYPRERLRTAWTRFLWHQFHDDVTGTSIPPAYQFSWNDELLSLNQFAGILTDAVRNVSAALDTRTTGVPLVVFNPIAEERSDVVEATVEFPRLAPAAIRVLDHATGREVPSQVVARNARSARVVFSATVPSVGFKVYEVLPGSARTPNATPRPAPVEGRTSSLSVGPSSLQNQRYTVKLDGRGNVSSIFDKQADVELLAAPIELQMLKDDSASWPAWEILWESVSAAPKTTFGNPKIRVVEKGPVRVALEVTRQASGSTVTERISLADGGDRVEFADDVSWKSPGLMLKAAFPMTATNPMATYDLGLGTIDRGNNEKNRYEVPGQQWADLTDNSQRYGAAILNDSKYGWDKPDDHTVRLTLLRTPMPTTNFVYQSSNDIGRHHFTYAVAGHKGSWRDGNVPARAAALNQRLLAFQTSAHGGPLGPWFSMINTQGSQGRFAVRAFKKAEDGDEVIVRLQELVGEPARATIALGVPIDGAREVTAAEEAIRPAGVTAGRVTIDLRAYQSRTLALKLQPGPRPAVARSAAIIDLPYNLDGLSADKKRGDGDFDGRGRTIAAELLPDPFEMHGVPFKFGPAAEKAQNVLVPRGQTIRLPAGSYTTLYVLASSAGGDTPLTVTFADSGGAPHSTAIKVQEWEGAIGQWDSRLVDDRLLRTEFIAPEGESQSWTLETIEDLTVTRFDKGTKAVTGLDRIRPGFMKRAEAAWVGTHRHVPEGNQPYVPSYVFAYAIPVPKGAVSIRLASNDRVRILAMTAAEESAPQLMPAGTIYAADLPEPATGRAALPSQARPRQ